LTLSDGARKGYACVMRLRRSDKLVLCAALAIAFVFGFSRPLLRLATPSDGAMFRRVDTTSEAMLFSGVDTTLRDGDQVVSINGETLGAWAGASRMFRAGLPDTGQPLRYRVIRDGVPLDLLVTTRPYVRERLTTDLANVFAALVYLGVGLYVFVRRPGQSVSLALLTNCLSIFCVNMLRAFDLEPTDVLHPWLFGWTVVMLTLIAPHFFSGMLHFSLVFPTTLPIVTRYRWLVPGIYIGIGATFLALHFVWAPLKYSDTLQAYQYTFQLSYALTAVLAPITFAISIYNGLRTTNALARQQWLLVFVGGLVGLCANLLIGWLPHFPGIAWTAPIGMQTLIECAFPIAIAVGVLRYRLWDIGAVVNRTLVYSTLTLFVITLYAAIVSTAGGLLNVQGNTWPSLFAAGLIAVLFQPLRLLLQRAVDRLMFGRRGNPHEIMTRMSARMSAVREAGKSLQAAVESVTHVLNTPYAEIALLPFVSAQQLAASRDAFVVAASAGDTALANSPDLEQMPLIHAGETIGLLRIAPRQPGEAFTSADERLLADMAPTITIAAHSARLTRELQRSRQHVVGTLETERRRLRRDLHDGFGPALAAVILNLDTLRSRIETGARGADVDGLLTDTRKLAVDALGDVRRVAYGLRPPALDDLGLTAALRQQVARIGTESGLDVAVRSELGTHALPAAVEVAAYRVATEALNNTVRHARARSAALELSIESPTPDEPAYLHVAFCDDGVGLPEQISMGVGLHSMRERVDELDGTLKFEAVEPHGTRVLARWPLPAAAAATEKAT
jgi:signal transduction histidine kinase